MAATREAPQPIVPSYPEADSFRALYRAQFGFVWRVLARLGYDPATPIRSWWYGIARRVGADVRRGGRRLDRKLRAMPAPVAMPSDPVEAMRRREAETIVEAFLATLDEDTRMVFVLVEIEGMTAPEVEVALGVKLNTVYSRLRRGRAAFARVVEVER